jgi:hypothetical protein
VQKCAMPAQKNVRAIKTNIAGNVLKHALTVQMSVR